MTEDAPQPVTGDLADIDLFTDKPVEYVLTDAKGIEHTWRIGADFPFPMALAFLDAWDDWVKAQRASMRARHATQQSATTAAYAVAWKALLERFLPIVQLLNPDVTFEQLHGVDPDAKALEPDPDTPAPPTPFGQSTMTVLIINVANRLDPTKYLDALREVAGPKARPKRKKASAPEASSG
jgi:hypothetical protein